jgi:CTP:molybdopterin cytidylyltransferase MocA
VIAAVVLAAGAATRFGAPKQQLLLDEVLARVAAAPVDEIVVVEGAYPLELRGSEPQAIRVVSCRGWERGPGASLRCGLATLSEDVEAAVVVLADGPDLAPASIARTVESWRRDGGDVVAASYAGKRGHPIVVARSVWSVVPDEGLRAGVRPRLVPCDDLGDPGDVDTPEDLPDRFR